jgi:hypothetical protein
MSHKSRFLQSGRLARMLFGPCGMMSSKTTITAAITRDASDRLKARPPSLCSAFFYRYEVWQPDGVWEASGRNG